MSEEFKPDSRDHWRPTRVPVVLPEPDLPDPGRYEDEHTWWGRRRRRRINAELERHNLAADIAELEAELGIGESCCDGLCIHHVRMGYSG